MNIILLYYIFIYVYISYVLDTRNVVLELSLWYRETSTWEYDPPEEPNVRGLGNLSIEYGVVHEKINFNNIINNSITIAILWFNRGKLEGLVG